MRICTQQYEDLLWNWQLPSGVVNLAQRQAFNKGIENLFLHAAINIEDKDKKIFQELNYKYYYEKSTEYFELRSSEKEAVIQKSIIENRRRAVMAILVDSFAHNVSAHSLTVLKWIFQQRAQMLADGIATNDIPEDILASMAGFIGEDENIESQLLRTSLQGICL